MNFSFVSIVTTLQPVIHIAALTPFLIAIIMWAVFYAKYDNDRLGKIGEAFKRLADDGEKLKDCTKENISFMDEMIVRMAPAYFTEAWIRMQMQLEKNYEGDFIPDGQHFYPFDAMVTVPGCRNRLDSLWKAFWVLGILAILLPGGSALFIQPDAILNALILGGFVFALLSITYLIFSLLDQRSYFNTKTEYHRFINVFDRILPVVKPEVALLLEATQRNRETYEAATGKIVDKFNNIVDDMILPALEDSISTIMHSNLIPAIHNIERTLEDNMSKTMELQEKGMDNMAAEFADRLADTVGIRLNELAETIGGVQSNMKLLNENMNDQIDTFTQSISKSLRLHQEHTSESMSLQDQSLERLKEHITKAIDFQDQSLKLHKEHMAKTLEVQDESLERQKAHINDAIALQSHALELQKEHMTEAIGLQDQRMKDSLDLHEQFMNNITASFSESLTNTVEAQMLELGETISNVGGQMDFVAASFTNSLEGALQDSLTSLNQELEQLQAQMGAINESLSTNVHRLTNMLVDQNQIMIDSAKLLTSSGEMQEKMLKDTKEMQARSVENADTLNSHVESMAIVLDKLTEQNTAFTKEAFQFTKETSESQMRMSETVKLSQDKLEEAVNETMNQYSKMNNMLSQMMDNITDRMNEAMTNAGREIAFGIKEVTADNAEAISNLTEQAVNLRNDYEDYFTRMENSTVKTIEEMDYQIRTITVRITEDIGTMMEENIKANGEILERYKDNTTDLLQSFDEQARSIGLYAKEMNMDISELSNNLQSSVGEFSTKIQEGVRMTLGEFDSGLSELTQRIANTVESISDAVEALPEAISKK